jgi:uncharacterized membrane protein
MKNYLKFLLILLALLGAIISGYLWYHHIVLVENLNSDNLVPCEIGESFNCDLVNTSVYSEMFGIPIAAFGLLAYLLILGLVLINYPKNQIRKIHILLTLTGLMSAYSIYLFIISKTVIGSYCLFCMATYLINFSLFGLVYLVFRSKTQSL